MRERRRRGGVHRALAERVARWTRLGTEKVEGGVGRRNGNVMLRACLSVVEGVWADGRRGRQRGVVHEVDFLLVEPAEESAFDDGCPALAANVEPE